MNHESCFGSGLGCRPDEGRMKAGCRPSLFRGWKFELPVLSPTRDVSSRDVLSEANMAMNFLYEERAKPSEPTQTASLNASQCLFIHSFTNVFIYGVFHIGKL